MPFCLVCVNKTYASDVGVVIGHGKQTIFDDVDKYWYLFSFAVLNQKSELWTPCEGNLWVAMGFPEKRFVNVESASMSRSPHQRLCTVDLLIDSLGECYWIIVPIVAPLTVHLAAWYHDLFKTPSLVNIRIVIRHKDSTRRCMYSDCDCINIKLSCENNKTIVTLRSQILHLYNSTGIKQTHFLVNINPHKHLFHAGRIHEYSFIYTTAVALAFNFNKLDGWNIS